MANWDFSTGEYQFASAEAIGYSDQSAWFVKIILSAKFQSGKWHDIELEIAHDSALTQAHRIAQRIRLAHDPVAYIRAILRNTQSRVGQIA
jgi:hypothetical protein